jgi:hypothetical protein
MKAGHLLVAVAASLFPGRLAGQTGPAPAIVPWHTWIGLSVGSAGLGFDVGRRVLPGLSLVGMLRSVNGSPMPVGLGLAVDVLQSREGRITIAAGGGAQICNCTDDEGGTAPSPTWPAAFLTAGGEFSISGSNRASVGLDFDEWITGTGWMRHFEAVSFVVRFYGDL